MVVERDGSRPLVLDLGTGLRFWGETFDPNDTVDADVLVSHLHWDHIQGLPFFAPGHRHGSVMRIHGPRQDGGPPLGEVVNTFLNPPYFPVGLADLAGEFRFHELGDSTTTIGEYTVTSRFVPHLGPTLGFRIESPEGSVTYVSDHQQPDDDAELVDDTVVELASGTDVLIHDAQYTGDEFTRKRDWGHCTIGYAIEVAAKAGVGRLVLFHHDPTHHDDWLDELGADAAAHAAERGVPELVVAREGLELVIGAP